MACVPGMPCFSTPSYDSELGNVITYTTYPVGCVPSSQQPMSSTLVAYSGPFLPNSEIENLDNLSVALQKLDNELSGESLVNAIILAVQSDPALKAALCAEIGTCP
jgi:hypothetical protein